MSEFKIRYPGQYDKREKPYIEAYAADCEALKKRGRIDVQALINGTLPEGTPGIGPVVTASEDMVMYNNLKYNPEEPILTDEEYARKAGYEGIPAMPAFAAHDDTFMTPMPHDMRDIMLVSGLNHSVTVHKPIYIGDVLYLVVDERHFTDLTPPEGSVYRSLAIEARGSIYNQKGELVNSVIFRVTENLKTYEDGKKPHDVISWEGPPWGSRESHYYTDEDWDAIRDIWSKEYRRGGDVLYWEDVNIGDEPAWTLDGPIDDSVEPTKPWGMGVGGSRSLKREIMDPEIFKTMVRNPYDGIWRLPKRSLSYPAFPEYAKPKYGVDAGGGSTSFQGNDDPASKPQDRFVFINFMGRDFAVRHFTNWAGDKGRLKNISWGIMPDECMRYYGYNLPKNPEAVSFLADVPEKRGQCLHHGMERDVFLVKSRIVGKYIEEGEHLVKLAWWIEVITGEMIEEGTAIVSLPSKA